MRPRRFPPSHSSPSRGRGRERKARLGCRCRQLLADAHALRSPDFSRKFRAGKKRTRQSSRPVAPGCSAILSLLSSFFSLLSLILSSTNFQPFHPPVSSFSRPRKNQCNVTCALALTPVHTDRNVLPTSNLPRGNGKHTLSNIPVCISLSLSYKYQYFPFSALLLFLSSRRYYLA